MSGSVGTLFPNHIFYGVREHAMAAISNGMAVSGLLPFCGTFLVFSDYMHPAIRVSCMMHLHVIYVFSHDSIGVGEDGPTHHPVEHIDYLRTLPNMLVLRPADANEVVECWDIALRYPGPVSLILSRQSTPCLKRNNVPHHVLSCCPIDTNMSASGAYVLEYASRPHIILLASGTEVHLCVEAAKYLKELDIRAQVVSAPSIKLFFTLSKCDYRDIVFPKNVPMLAVEASSGVTLSFIAHDVIGVTGFGVSAPGPEVYRHFSITVDEVIRRSIKLANSR